MTTIIPVAVGGELSYAEHDQNIDRDVKDPTEPHTVVAADNRSVLEIAGASVVTLPDATTFLPGMDATDFRVTVKNLSPSNLLIRPTGADTINGVNADFEHPSLQAYTFYIDHGATDWEIKDSSIPEYSISKTILSGWVSSISAGEFKLGGFGSVISTSAEHVMIPMPCAGRVRGFYVKPNANTLSSTLTCTVWKYNDQFYHNTQYAAAGTGQGIDVTSSFEVAAGDYIYVAFDAASGTGSASNIRYTIDIVALT